ncbi:Uncharacterised protein [Serratia fonticola]|nr:Uncharacterised protein [Serratia fonticola]
MILFALIMNIYACGGLWGKALIPVIAGKALLSYPMEFKLQLGGQLAHPQELTFG